MGPPAASVRKGLVGGTYESTGDRCEIASDVSQDDGNLGAEASYDRSKLAGPPDDAFRVIGLAPFVTSQAQ
jgi:hypothetical protein